MLGVQVAVARYGTMLGLSEIGAPQQSLSSPQVEAELIVRSRCWEAYLAYQITLMWLV